ncbi:required for meiotic nuclear division protein 1 homolog [Planococcus citri]|uniref:required for meiotic nuclear division protein 1 homolog n=1 Tax=Planococcus citri TaxID=170843 RepID=UPI0031F7733B
MLSFKPFVNLRLSFRQLKAGHEFLQAAASFSKPHRFVNLNNTVARWSSQHNTQEVITSTVANVKTKRPVRGKKLIQGTVEKTGFWNVVAVATAEEYDLENAYKALNKSDKYKPSDFFLQVYESVAKSNVDNESREIFLFREGSLVAWNVSDAEIKHIIDFVSNFEINQYDNAVVNDEIEVMPYTYSINSKNSLLNKGNICLTQEQDKCSFDKYTFSNGMTISVKLGIWESLLDRYIESLAPLTMDLKMGKRIKISREEMLKKTGELYALKHSINLSSDLLDVPDFYWEREDLEKLYLNTCRYFNIPRRTKVINEKLNHCIELVDLLSSHLSDRHHIRLELMIIALIMIEVAFEIIHYAQVFSQN